MDQPMKFVIAAIRPHRLDDVLEALTRIGMQNVTVTEARDYSQRGPREIYRGTEFTQKYLPMLKVEVAVPDVRVRQVVGAIISSAHTGQPGDGRIFVFGLDTEMQIRIDATADVRALQAA